MEILSLVSFLVLFFNPNYHCGHLSKCDLASGFHWKRVGVMYCAKAKAGNKTRRCKIVIRVVAARALLRPKGVDHDRCA